MNPLHKTKVSFANVKDKTLGEVFGVQPLTTTDMIKVLWTFIKGNSLKSKEA